MRRDLLLGWALAALLASLVLGAVWGLLALPALPDDLLPAEATIAQVQSRGASQQVTARLAPRQGLQSIYKHLTQRGWNMRRVNLVPEDESRTYFRRSMGGYLLEVAIVERPGAQRDVVTIAYRRCLRHLTCAWR
jgi:hypothetical protein